MKRKYTVAVYGWNGDIVRWILVSTLPQAHRVVDWALKFGWWAARISSERSE